MALKRKIQSLGNLRRIPRYPPSAEDHFFLCVNIEFLPSMDEFHAGGRQFLSGSVGKKDSSDSRLGKNLQGISISSGYKRKRSPLIRGLTTKFFLPRLGI